MSAVSLLYKNSDSDLNFEGYLPEGLRLCVGDSVNLYNLRYSAESGETLGRWERQDLFVVVDVVVRLNGVSFQYIVVPRGCKTTNIEDLERLAVRLMELVEGYRDR